MILQLDHISFRYNSDSPPVLAGVDLAVEPGRSLAVVGPSGCGKSTLLNIIGTLEKPSAGCVRLEGTDLGALGEQRLAAVRNRKIGFIFQDHHLLPQCTVLENVLVPTLAQRGSDRQEARRWAEHLLSRVGLADRMHHRPGEISGGQRQRAAVVRALVNHPRLLLADEPTGSLDRASAADLGELLSELNREQGVTLIVVTHSAELASKMQKSYELRDGKLQEVESSKSKV